MRVGAARGRGAPLVEHEHSTPLHEIDTTSQNSSGGSPWSSDRARPRCSYKESHGGGAKAHETLSTGGIRRRYKCQRRTITS